MAEVAMCLHIYPSTNVLINTWMCVSYFLLSFSMCTNIRLQAMAETPHRPPRFSRLQVLGERVQVSTADCCSRRLV